MRMKLKARATIAAKPRSVYRSLGRLARSAWAFRSTAGCGRGPNRAPSAEGRPVFAWGLNGTVGAVPWARATAQAALASYSLLARAARSVMSGPRCAAPEHTLWRPGILAPQGLPTHCHAIRRQRRQLPRCRLYRCDRQLLVMSLDPSLVERDNMRDPWLGAYG